MVNPFICGGGSFHNDSENEDELIINSPSSTPTRSRSKTTGKSSFSRGKESKNPYSDRGLDKFTALLAELEDKKQRIYTEVGPDAISFVRFVYSNANDCKPIVVRARDPKQQEKAHKESMNVRNNTVVVEPSQLENEVNQSRNTQSGDKKTTTGNEKKWDFLKMGMWRRPSWYLPMAIIFILVFLAIFGRSFAILCTSLGWYLVPTIKGGSSRPRKKKEYRRRASEKKVIGDGLASPTSVIAGAANEFSSPQRRHRKSW